MKQKGGHGLKARIKINDIPQAQLDLLNSSTVTYEIRDTKTGVLESTVTRPMRSFTANFLRLLWGRMTGTACAGGLDINDTAIDESSGKATNLKCVGATTGLKKFGICIGTGTGAVAQTDNKLTWDTGFTTYGATTLKTATVISGSDIYFEIQKAFTNNTGSTRTIYEAGLCTTGEGTEADNNTNVLIARELTNGATGTAVATGKVLTVVFKISSTFTTDGIINKLMMKSLENAFLGNVGEIFTSLNTSPGYGVRYGAGCVFNGNFWVIAGYTGSARKKDVWYTPDGISWTQATSNAAFGERSDSAVCVYDGKMWLFGGNDNAGTKKNDVWYSTDGATWTQATASALWSARFGHGACTYDGKMWVAGGNDGSLKNDVYYSTDGVNWTQATASAAWSARYINKKILVYNSKMWIIGGYTTTYVGDVYYSTDGATWTQATAAAEWTKRHGAGLCVYDQKMMLIGGTDGTIKNDVWSSTNGATWTQISSGATTFPATYAHISEVLNGEIIVANGIISTGNVDDVFGCFVSPFRGKETTTSMPDSGRIDATSAAIYGITVGTGTENFVGSDVALETAIADGSTSGKLTYGNMQDAGRLSEPTVSGSNNVMRLERDFANNSGGAITINEVGLSAKGLDALGLLLMRGKVDKAVADGASVRVAIELETTV